MSLSAFVSKSCRDGIEEPASERGLYGVLMFSSPYRARECKKKLAGTGAAHPGPGLFVPQLGSRTTEHSELGKCLLLTFRVLIYSRAFRENLFLWPFSFRERLFPVILEGEWGTWCLENFVVWEPTLQIREMCSRAQVEGL